MKIINKLVQILVGLLFIAAGLLSIRIANDATAACVIVPLGVYIAFAREPKDEKRKDKEMN